MENTEKLLYIIWDSKTKSLLSIFDDEKQQLKYLRNLIREDIHIEKFNLKKQILEIDNKDEAQRLEMNIIQLEHQEKLNNLRHYIRDDKVIQRYFTYMKPMNDSKIKIFFN